MFQRWNDLLFAHWAVPAEQIRPLVPRELEIDIFDGRAWIGVIPFWMSGVRFRGLPPIPTAANFPELNVRTYVRAPQQPARPGVYFFSLDAASSLAVLGARAGVGLPYFWAKMSAELRNEEVTYRSLRRQGHTPAELVVNYRATSSVLETKSALEQFVTERYLYVVRMGRIHRVQIHHLPWPLQPAEAEFEVNSMAAASGIQLPAEKPILQFVKSLDVYVFPPEQIG